MVGFVWNYALAAFHYIYACGAIRCGAVDIALLHERKFAAHFYKS